MGGLRHGGRGERCLGAVAVVRVGQGRYAVLWTGGGQRIAERPGVFEVFGFPEFFELRVVSGIPVISAHFVVVGLNSVRPGIFRVPEVFEVLFVVAEVSVAPEPVRPFVGAVVVMFHRAEYAELKIGLGRGLIGGRRTVRRV